MKYMMPCQVSIRQDTDKPLMFKKKKLFLINLSKEYVFVKEEVSFYTLLHSNE